MRTINLDELQFCGQCGSKLLPDKSCPKRDCPVSSRATNANYSTTATTLPFGERYQGRISQTFDSLLDDTLSTSRAQSLSRPKRNRRRVIVLTVLVMMLVSAVFIGVEIGKGNAAGTVNTGQNNPSTSAPPNSGTSISNSNITSTVTSPTQITTLNPSPTPSLTLSPIPMASPTPTSSTSPVGKVLYQADWSNGLDGWSGNPDWKVLNGILLNDGSDSSDAAPTIVAPYQLIGRSDYAVEARIQVINGTGCFDALTIRASATTNGWQGYKAVVCNGTALIDAGISSIQGSIAQTSFNPGNTWHTYRLETKGTEISLYIDGALMLDAQDNRFLSGGQFGFKSFESQLNISEFRVLIL